jgi:MHS family proline/betaine transporter-like MFS transporter
MNPQIPMTRRSIAIAAMSTVVEWYDFTLYLYFATVLARLFFPGGGGLVTALGGFALAYLMRPIGAVVFGHFGDTRGRRPAMLASMALMTAAMAVTAMLPTAAQVGPVAGALLVGVRCVMGFSVGGEYTGVVAYLLEGAAPGRRGLMTSLAAAASEIGGLLAVGISALTVWLLPEASVASWGWRLPFVFGALLAGSVLFARTHIEETPHFDALRKARAVAASPLRDAVRDQRPGIVRGFAISALGSITYYVGITYVPTYLTTVAHVPESRALGVTAWAAVAVIAVTPLTGMMADRWGRRPVIVAFALASAVLPIVLFHLMVGSSWAFVCAGTMALAILAGGVSAVGAVASAEQVPAATRLSGLALGVTSATAFFGGFAPWLAQVLIGQTGSPLVPGILIAIVAVAVLPVLWTMPETRVG